MARMQRPQILFLCALAGNLCAAGELNPTHLRCEYSGNPLGIDARTPRLSWQLESKARGQRQTAYRILVASSLAGLASGPADLWDSGKISSDQCVCVPYAGKPLLSRQRCCWKVQVWDADQRMSSWSRPSSWTMGLIEAGDWKAQWIGKDQADAQPPGPAPSAEDPRLAARMLRKEFDAPKPVARATVYLSGLGLSELLPQRRQNRR